MRSLIIIRYKLEFHFLQSFAKNLGGSQYAISSTSILIANFDVFTSQFIMIISSSSIRIYQTSKKSVQCTKNYI